MDVSVQRDRALRPIQQFVPAAAYLLECLRSDELLARRVSAAAELAAVQAPPFSLICAIRYALYGPVNYAAAVLAHRRAAVGFTSVTYGYGA